jgi:hypothetical protein
MEVFQLRFEYQDGLPVFTDGKFVGRQLRLVFGQEDPRVFPGHYDIDFEFRVTISQSSGNWSADWITEDCLNHDFYKDNQPGLEIFIQRVNMAIKSGETLEFRSEEDYFKDFQGMMFWVVN